MGELLDFGVWMQKRHERGEITESNLLVVAVAIFQYMKYSEFKEKKKSQSSPATTGDSGKMPRCPRGITSPDALCVDEYLCYDECWSVVDGWQEKTPERQGRRRR